MDIRINNVASAYRLHNTDNAKRPRRLEGSNSSGKDTFTLSHVAGDYVMARQVITSVPDVRQEKIDDVQERMASSLYPVSAQQLAEKIMQNYEVSM